MERLADLDFCIIDTETTGGRASQDRVIDIAVYRVRDGIILEKYQSLVNPGIPIPPWITGLTGIDNDMVKRAPFFSDIQSELFQILGKGIFTAHNAAFDYGFVQQEFLRQGIEFIRPHLCTVRLARHLYPELPSRSLGALCEHLLIDIYDRHRAAGDAEATVYVLKDLLKKVRDQWKLESWQDLDSFIKFGPLELPGSLKIGDIASLPGVPGQYIFKNKEGKIIFRGKTKNIQERIRNLFRKSNQTPRAHRYRQIVESISILE
jgi:DNA polymerase-3 subunit epsilon